MQSKNDAETVADVIVDVLHSFGSEYVFGIPGTQVNRIIDRIRVRCSPKFILVRDEAAGAVMATIVSRLSGKLGACLGMAAPGAVKLVSGLYNAKIDHTPVIALTGQSDTYHLGLDYTQEVDVVSLFGPLSVYNQLLVSPKNSGYIASTACRQAVEQRGVAHLCIPEDIQEATVPDRQAMKEPRVAIESKLVPDEKETLEAGRILNSARNVAIIVGRGGENCGSLIGILAEKLHAPVYTTFPGRDSIRSDHPNNMGIAWIFSPRSGDVIERADALILIGTDYPYMQEVFPTGARVIQIDSYAHNLGKRVRVDVSILSSTDLALNRLIGMLKEGARDESYLSFAREYMSEMFEMIEDKRDDNSIPINPYRLVKEIESSARDDAIFTTDAGAVELYFSSGFRFKSQKFVVHGRYASLGFGVPAAIASQLVYPKREVIAVEGDFGFMTSLAELMTAVENSLPIKIIVFNNGGQAAIKFEQMTQGLAEYGTKFKDFNFAKFAEACGAYGKRVADPAELPKSLDEFLSKKEPGVLDVLTSSDQLPIF